jgi:hypothetical protein
MLTATAEARASSSASARASVRARLVANGDAASIFRAIGADLALGELRAVDDDLGLAAASSTSASQPPAAVVSLAPHSSIP